MFTYIGVNLRALVLAKRPGVYVHFRHLKPASMYLSFQQFDL